MQVLYPSLTNGLMAPHQIFSTTENFANVVKKAINLMQLTKIRWEDTLNVANPATDESEGSRKFQKTTQLKK